MVDYAKKKKHIVVFVDVPQFVLRSARRHHLKVTTVAAFSNSSTLHL